MTAQPIQTDHRPRRSEPAGHPVTELVWFRAGRALVVTLSAYRHGLRSVLTPVVTQLGVDLGALLGGVIVTEQVFGMPGPGQLAWQSVTAQDLPVIIGTVLVASAFIVVANLLVELGYALLDPRVRPS